MNNDSQRTRCRASCAAPSPATARTSKRRLRMPFERLTHGINDPRSERADCNIELNNGQRFKLVVMELD